LHNTEKQLVQSQKLEAVGRLAGGISHDFNNLLTVILGYSDITKRNLPEGDPLRRNVDEIIRASERAASLTRQLLAFSRKQVMQPRVFDLNDVVNDLEKMLRRMIGEDIELRVSADRDLGNIKADPVQLEQVIMNLVVNARDAMPKGGKLSIETANVYLDESYSREHVSVVPGHYVMLAISDTGCGMNEETRQRIFEPFFTTKEQGKGTGLGLSMVYGIVKQSGGNIWVYSEEGHGTTFKSYFPRVTAQAEEYKRSARAFEAPAGSETILLVEDAELVRTLARQVLETAGYRVLEAANADAAIRLCEKMNGDRIDLLLTDVVMPGMSGNEMSRILLQRQPDMPVLYMSGYTDDAIVQHGVLEAGINFLQKPFTPAALAFKVREVLDAR
jgi:CheY-like chemotaxis protein/two-component sensor histidine kinase